MLCAALFSACGTTPSAPEAPATPPEASAPNTGKRCFRSVTTAGDGSYSDTMSITLDFANNAVEGRMDRLPGMKDKMRGTLKGTLDEGRLTALYTYSAEGVEQTEQRLFNLGEDHITILSGEMTERDGLWVLKDPDTAVEGMKVPAVDRR